MDVKTKEVQASPFSGQKERTTSYLSALKEELKKVTWTTKAELIFCTKIAVSATFLFGLGIYIVDILIKGVLGAVGKFAHFIFG